MTTENKKQKFICKSAALQAFAKAGLSEDEMLAVISLASVQCDKMSYEKDVHDKKAASPFWPAAAAVGILGKGIVPYVVPLSIAASLGLIGGAGHAGKALGKALGKHQTEEYGAIGALKDETDQYIDAIRRIRDRQEWNESLARNAKAKKQTKPLY